MHLHFDRGFGSDVAAHPTNNKQTITDLPNADYNDGVKVRFFPMPDYVPKIRLFEEQDDGSIKLIQNDFIKDRDGNNISGLPNTAALGGTGETPYDIHGKVIAKRSIKAL